MASGGGAGSGLPGGPQGSPNRRGYVKSQLDPRIKLTRHQVNILVCMSRGRRIPALAGDLEISCDTLYEQIDGMRKKLGASTNLELVRLAIKHGFVEV